MGGGNFDRAAYRSYAASAQSKSSSEIFSNQLNAALDPRRAIRESRDSAEHPESTPVILALDVTGSMGFIAENIVKKQLGEIMGKILEGQVVPDPQLMFMGIGDIHCDSAPLQVSQFESDMRIVDQLQLMWLEGHGGGNDSESYDLAWWFAANRTEIDCNSRGKKGYLFTFGDECVPRGASSYEMMHVFDVNEGFEPSGALRAAQEKYHCFHFMITQGNYMLNLVRRDRAISSWRGLMGNRAIVVDDVQYLPELIIATILLNEGASPEQVLSSVHASAQQSIKTAFLLE